MLKDIQISQIEALLAFMYVGEVEVKQSELAGLVKAAECLRIKGLAILDEDSAVCDSSETQHFVSINSNSDKTSNSSSRRTGVNEGSPSPPRKRRRKDVENDRESDPLSSNENRGEETSNSTPNFCPSSSDGQKSPQNDDTQSKFFPLVQIKVEPDIQIKETSDSVDVGAAGSPNLSEQCHVEVGLSGLSPRENNYQKEHKIFLENENVDKQMDGSSDSGAGPSGLQKVRLYVFNSAFKSH